MIEDVSIMVAGCVIVLAALAFLWAVTSLVGVLVKAGGGVHARARARNGNGNGNGASDEGIPAHHLAVIAAAVATVIEAPHRIVRVAAPAHRTPAWAGHGRITRDLPQGMGFRPAIGGLLKE